MAARQHRALAIAASILRYTVSVLERPDIASSANTLANVMDVLRGLACVLESSDFESCQAILVKILEGLPPVPSGAASSGAASGLASSATPEKLAEAAVPRIDGGSSSSVSHEQPGISTGLRLVGQ